MKCPYCDKPISEERPSCCGETHGLAMARDFRRKVMGPALGIEKQDRTFGELAFEALSEKLGRSPSADEIIEFVQGNAQDAIEDVVNE